MAISVSTTHFSFLAAGPQYNVMVPADVLLPPQLSSPLRTGLGGREFEFIPRYRDSGLDSQEFNRLADLKDRDGRQVEFYERLEPPPLWWLRWRLPGGALYTHLREEDTAARGEMTAAHISIVEDSSESGRPTILPEPPFRLAVSSWPGYQEQAKYFFERGDRTLIFQRPGFVAPGQVMQAPTSQDGGSIFLRAGTDLGLEVQVISGTQTEGRELIDLVLGSLQEGFG